MELIDRYLQAVKSALPKRNQDDVIRELSDEILSRVEEKENALGRPLTEDEQVALLKQLGHPWVLANRYRTGRYLISPSLFAVYWVVLRLVLIVVFFSMAIAAVSVAASGQGLEASLSIFWHFPVAALQVFAWVTVVFVALEIIEAKFDFFGKWDPRTLPKLSNKKRPSMSQNIAGMVFSAIFGVWWLVGLKHQFWIFGPGVFFIRFGPVWQTIYPIFVVLVVFSIIRSAIDVARPGWERGRTWIRLIFRGLNLLVLYFLFSATDMFVPGPSSPTGMNDVVKNLNHGMHLGVLVVAIIAVVQLGQDVYSLIRDRFNGAEHAAACFFL